MQTRRDRKKTQMRERIVQTGMRLFRSHGLNETTMEAIAEAADVSKRTLYTYFPVKEAIVSAHWLNNVEEKSNLLPLLLETFPDTRKRLIAVFLDAAKGLMAEPELARIHFYYQLQQIGKHGPPHLDNGFVQFLTQVIGAGQTYGDIRNDLPANELAVQVMLNFTAICLIWFSNPGSFSLDERLTLNVHCFIEGAGKTPINNQ